MLWRGLACRAWAFLRRLREELQADLRFKESLGIWQLPAFLVQYGESAVLLAGVPRADDMAAAVERVLAAVEFAGG